MLGQFRVFTPLKVRPDQQFCRISQNHAKCVICEVVVMWPLYRSFATDRKFTLPNTGRGSRYAI